MRMRLFAHVLAGTASLLALTMAGSAPALAASSADRPVDRPGAMAPCFPHDGAEQHANLDGVGKARWTVYCDGGYVYAAGYVTDNSWDGHDACIVTRHSGTEVAWDSYEHKGATEFRSQRFKGDHLELLLRSCDVGPGRS